MLLLLLLLLGDRLLNVMLGCLLSLPNLSQKLVQLRRLVALMLLLLLLLHVMLPRVEGRVKGARLQQWLWDLACMLLVKERLRQVRLLLLLHPWGLLLRVQAVRHAMSQWRPLAQLRRQGVQYLPALLKPLYEERVLHRYRHFCETYMCIILLMGRHHCIA